MTKDEQMGESVLGEEQERLHSNTEASQDQRCLGQSRNTTPGACLPPTASAPTLVPGQPLRTRELVFIKVPLARLLILYLPCSTVGHRKLAQAVIIDAGIWGTSLLQGVGAQQSL